MAITNIRSGQVKDGDLTDVDIATANKDGVAGTASMRTLGTGAQTACAGNDSRLSDVRTPTAFNLLSAVDVALADTVPIYDASGSANKSVTVDRFGAFVNPSTFNARLTGTTGVAVTTSDVSSGTLFLTPYRGDKVVIFDGTRHVMYTLTEKSLSVTGLAPGAHDIFVFDNAGTLTLEAVAWAVSTKAITAASNASPIVITSNSHGLTADQVVVISGVVGNTAANRTSRVGTVATNTFQLLDFAAANVAGNGNYVSGGTWWRIDENTARVTALTTQDGVLYKNGSLTKRYVGTIFNNSSPTGAVTDTVLARFIWNYYNRVRRDLLVNVTASHTYATATWRAFNNDLANGVEFVIGVQEDAISISIGGDISSGTGHLAFAPDGVTGTNPSIRHSGAVTNRAGQAGFYPKTVGYHNLRMAQIGAASTAYAASTMTVSLWS